MKIQLLSDLHLEFLPDQIPNFVYGLDPSDVDVLVLAGDIVTRNTIEGLTCFSDHYSNSEIIYVTGNHEFYGTYRPYMMNALRNLEQDLSNLHLLDHESIEVQGRWFLGSPLWYRPTRACMDLLPYWGEFEAIPGWERWVFEENYASMLFFEEHLKEGDIVVSHYLPCSRSIAPEWRNSNSNVFFYCEMDSLIAERKPALWLHGHTHSSCDYNFFDTRIVCNPRGYEGHELNSRWQEKLIIEV